ncbi:helix-turn-helix domain-containing protein [Streptomyces sp. NPDC012935]|uniref:helix-turn-helix domain-containing protein n=1 Tax=Streptomyces sp. NPDC012935 TaxID=3364857 RepID=UPI00368FD5BF
MRGALVALADSGELEVLDDLDGPQHATVYRLPRAAAWLAKMAAARKDDPEAYVESLVEADPVPELEVEQLRMHGLWPKTGSESDAHRQNLTGSESAPPRQNLTPPRVRFRPLPGSDSDPQNRSEPKVNRRYSSSGAADLTSAADWQVDDASLSWAQQQGHLDRLGEHRLQAADTKWRQHRGTWSARPASTWADDWRSWIARERSPTPQRPNLHALPRGDPAPQAGMTRADAHMAALLAALEEPTETE